MVHPPPAARTLASILLVCLASHALATENGGYDHRAHSVPGGDRVVYDLDASGSEEVTVDGSGSHSHFFSPGPPISNGLIKGFEWVNAADGTVVCRAKVCRLTFLVGETVLKLRVWDNTGDTAEDRIKVTVLPRWKAKSPPRIYKLSPDRGPAGGGNTVTIRGDYLYSDSKVFFGGRRCTHLKVINLKTIVCEAPRGIGTRKVRVFSSLGSSKALRYKFQAGGSVPVDFDLQYWKTPNGSRFKVEEVTGITIGKDHRYFLSSLTGYVTVVRVKHDLVVRNPCKVFLGKGRMITDVAYNPLDPYNRVFVATNTFYHKKNGATWHNGKVEAVYVGDDGCPVRGKTIISGLPVSSHDHGGPNKIAFNTDGKMLMTVGSFTNAGHSAPNDGIGGVPENPFSAAVVEADYLKPGFDGKVVYDQTKDPATANVVGGDVRLFATGVRNSFGLVVHSNGEVYATDNGPNAGFGRTSVSCNTSVDDAAADDKLVRLVRGHYYGHPNRNRGREDPQECRYRPPWDASGKGYVEPLGLMASSTNGIVEYRARTFQGALRGDLFMSQVAFREPGTLWRAELSPNGQWVRSGPYRFRGRSGLSIVQGHFGELVMPQLKMYNVLVFRPREAKPVSVELINVYPSRGPRKGGTVIMLTGHFLNGKDVVITVGGRACTDLFDVRYESVRCTVPAGKGKVKVVVRQGEFRTSADGYDFEYL